MSITQSTLWGVVSAGGESVRLKKTFGIESALISRNNSVHHQDQHRRRRGIQLF